MANPDHLNMLGQGVDAWNAWRKMEDVITPGSSQREPPRGEPQGGGPPPGPTSTGRTLPGDQHHSD
jgi:hypothetical protein